MSDAQAHLSLAQGERASGGIGTLRLDVDVHQHLAQGRRADSGGRAAALRLERMIRWVNHPSSLRADRRRRYSSRATTSWIYREMEYLFKSEEAEARAITEVE